MKSSLGFNHIKKANQAKPKRTYSDIKKKTNINLNNKRTKNRGGHQKADQKSVFAPKPKKKPIQYGNIRVNKSIVNKLKVAQYADGFKSRSDLLAAMYEYCKPAIFKTTKQKQRAKKFKKVAKIKNSDK